MSAQSVPSQDFAFRLNSSSEWEALKDFYTLMPDQWPEWVTGQTVVMAIMAVAVTCSCLYGLLTGRPRERARRVGFTAPASTGTSSTGTSSGRLDNGYARLPSRESSVDDARVEMPRPSSEARVDDFWDSLMFLWWLRVE